MYLATVIDTYSRKLAGYALADHMRGLLVIDALAHAHGVRGSLDGAVFHSDHGSVGGFNWLSQHPEHGGMRRWLPRTGVQTCALPICPRSRGQQGLDFSASRTVRK